MEFSGKFKLPSFLPNDVELWLRQVDTRLELLKFTTESQKYKYVSSCLPPEAVKVASDLIRNEPADNPYTALKTRIKEEFELTSTAKIRKLLADCRLGDRKPSALLCEMRQLNANRVNDEILRELFYKALRKTIRTILITTRVTDLDIAAKAADETQGSDLYDNEMNAVSEPSPQISS